MFDDDTKSHDLPSDAPVLLVVPVGAIIVKLARLSKIMIYVLLCCIHILPFYSVCLSILSMSIKTVSVRFRTIR